MKLDKAARAILSITALAWSIPLAQAADVRQPGNAEAQASSAEFRKLDADGDGMLSFKEIEHLRAYHKPFAEADRNNDGQLSPEESITAQQLYERALAERYARDAWITAKVKTALLREEGLESLDVSVETLDRQVLLSGFVESAEQKKNALLVASRIEGVEDVKDGLHLRK